MVQVDKPVQSFCTSKFSTPVSEVGGSELLPSASIIATRYKGDCQLRWTSFIAKDSAALSTFQGRPTRKPSSNRAAKRNGWCWHLAGYFRTCSGPRFRQSQQQASPISNACPLFTAESTRLWLFTNPSSTWLSDGLLLAY
jgi:hypothetical protein